jgi:hypothetical protein
MEDMILNRNPAEQCPGFAAVLCNPGPQGLNRHERLLVAKSLHEVET